MVVDISFNFAWIQSSSAILKKTRRDRKKQVFVVSARGTATESIEAIARAEQYIRSNRVDVYYREGLQGTDTLHLNRQSIQMKCLSLV